MLFPNANRQSFVAVTHDGGRKYLKSSENHTWGRVTKLDEMPALRAREKGAKEQEQEDF